MSTPTPLPTHDHADLRKALPLSKEDAMSTTPTNDDDPNLPAILCMDEPGRVTWHSSEEDGGPDVGLSFELGDGTTLYVGDIPRSRWEEDGGDALGLGDDNGWWITLYRRADAKLLGKVPDQDAGRALIDALSAAWNRRASPAVPAREADATEHPIVRAARTYAAAYAKPDVDHGWLDDVSEALEVLRAAVADHPTTDAALSALSTPPQPAGEGWKPMETPEPLPAICRECGWTGDAATELEGDGDCPNGCPASSVSEASTWADKLKVWQDSEGALCGQELADAGMIEPRPATKEEARRLDLKPGDTVWSISAKGHAETPLPAPAPGEGA